jgi:hypothetical protein
MVVLDRKTGTLEGELKMANKRTLRAGAWLRVMALAGVVLMFGAAFAAAPASPIVGDWNGTLSVGDNSLHLVVHFSEDKDGKFSGTMDSPDQNADGLVMANITFTEPDVHFDIPSIAGTYDGKISKGNSEIAGTWKQSDHSLPLTFTQAAK